MKKNASWISKTNSTKLRIKSIRSKRHLWMFIKTLCFKSKHLNHKQVVSGATKGLFKSMNNKWIIWLKLVNRLTSWKIILVNNYHHQIKKNQMFSITRTNSKKLKIRLMRWKSSRLQGITCFLFRHHYLKPVQCGDRMM